MVLFARSQIRQGWTSKLIQQFQVGMQDGQAASHVDSNERLHIIWI